MKKAALGRGLSSLIPDSYVKKETVRNAEEPTVTSVTETVQSNVAAPTGVAELPLNLIEANKEQPRTLFDESELEALTASIREQGVIQPIIVQKKKEDEGYSIVCGERRYRASKKAGLKTIPAVIKDIAPDDLLAVALIENIQRQDLNVLEEAEAYLKLYERGLSHEEIAKKVGRNRTTVVNVLRLLKLPHEVKQLVIEKKISEGHARSLLALPTPDYQIRLAKRILDEALSVRQTEEIIKKKAYQKRPAKKLRNIDSQILDLERKLEDALGSKVRFFAGKNKGRIEIKYFSLDELDRILSILKVSVD